MFHRARYRPDPVLWATLDRHGLTVRGEPFTVTGGYAACDLIDAVVNGAASMRGGRPAR